MFTNLIPRLAIPFFVFALFSLHAQPANAWSFNFGWFKSAEKTDTPAGLSKSLTKNLKTDREKITAIFDWITDNIAYDTVAFQTNRPQNLTAEETLLRRKGVCDNFAVLFNEMANSVGIKSSITRGVTFMGLVDGTSQADHAWNVVVVDGQKLIVDTTWGSGFYDHKTRTFTKVRNNQYLLADPTFLSLTHLELDQVGRIKMNAGLTVDQFKEIKANTRQLVRLGFDSKTLVQAINSNREDALPKAFEPAEPGIRFMKAPASRLSLGQSAEISVSHPDNIKVYLTDGSQLRPFNSVGSDRSELTANIVSKQTLTVIYSPSKSKDPNEFYKLLEYSID